MTYQLNNLRSRFKNPSLSVQCFALDCEAVMKNSIGKYESSSQNIFGAATSPENVMHLTDKG
jgi:hypothetical protein